MKKVYLLLRNNSQSGPFSIDELLQQQLKASDLIWREGSGAWRHPFEMDEFSITISKNEHHTPAADHKTPHYKRKPKPRTVAKEKKIPPSFTMDNLEKRAEEIRQRALNYQALQTTQLPQLQSDEETGYDFPVSAAAAADVRMVYHTPKEKKRSVDITQPVTFVLIAIWLGAVFFKGSIPLFNNKTEPVNSVATQMMTEDLHTAKAPVQAQPVANIPAPVIVDTVQHKDSIRAVAIVPKHKIAKPVTEPAESTQINQPVVSNNSPVNKPEEKKPEEKKQESTTDKSASAIVVTPQQTEKKEPEVQNKEAALTSEVKEEKKSGFFKKLFGKKKKEDTTASGTVQQ